MLEGHRASLSEYWATTPYPAFRRLTMYAARTKDPINAAALLRNIGEQPFQWLWSADIQVELYATIPKLWERLTPSEKDGLIALIVEGPPRDRYDPELDEIRWQSIHDREIWER